MGKTVKNFYTGTGEQLTDEQREAIKQLEQDQAKERQELFVQIEKKKEEEKGAIDFMNASFKPFEDRVLVFPDPVDNKTASGLYKPDSVVEKVKPLIGTVVRFGPGKDFTLPLTEGMRVYYGNYAGTELTLNGIKYLVMRFADIFGEV